MSFAARATATADRLVAHFGEAAVVTVRSRHSLMDALSGSVISELALVGDHAAGASILTLAADGLQGDLVAGVELTIAGAATVYTVGASVTAKNGLLSAVPISPPLAAPALDEAEVGITSAWTEATRPCAVRAFRNDQVDNEFVLAEDRMVIVSLGTGPLHVDVGSDVVLSDGRRYPVKAVLPLQPGPSRPSALRLHVGSAR